MRIPAEASFIESPLIISRISKVNYSHLIIDKEAEAQMAKQ